ncbi:penicillin-binding protein 2 [Solimonas terrae]|uniref:Peptidoglycan D,D-transpeptidase MrdA n=1 Tax=Solimonas terrae TaxID=1396819 RepID=A0A6M2BY27_9GAMM|nr:penicillin-binding protein 2 [Solimonas terrae]NGY06727.1 penicillin-binding protein 2 [Solimonas terrae]
MALFGRHRRDALKNIHAERDAFLRRAGIAVLFCAAGVVLLIVRLSDLQIVEHDHYQTRADENRMRVVPVAPVRGLIYDRNGTLLAQNQPAFVLEVTPEQIGNHEAMDALLARLSHVVTLTDADIARFKDRVRKSPRYRGVPLRSNLTMEEVARYEVDRHQFPGVDINAGLTRNYPLGASASHLVGYVGGISEEELRAANESEFLGLTQIGKTGVEKSEEDLLRGEPGAKIIEANAYGRPLRELDYQRGYPGRNLYLSIDTKVQLVAEEAMGNFQGSVVALDPRNGEIIAMVSEPGFDPQAFVSGIDNQTYQALLNDPSRPLFNRSLQGLYPPGSTVKPAMALAGLEYGVVTPEHTEYCRGEMTLPGSSRKYHCWKRTGHGPVDMAEGVKRSCDIYFYNLAMNLGIDRMYEAMTGFGLGHATGVDLPLEKDGLYPSREWKRKTRHENWYPGETLNVGIGQGYVLVTPMQLAQMVARIAMRGGGFKPHVLHATEDPITRKVTAVEPQALPKIKLKDENDWSTVIAAMESVAQEQGGTAWMVGHGAPYRIAAKTGSAQVAGLRQDEARPTAQEDLPLKLRDHALFIAFAPADDPKIAVAVIAEHGGHGASFAGPIARQVMDQYLLGYVLYGNENATEQSSHVTPSMVPGLAVPNPAKPASATENDDDDR